MAKANKRKKQRASVQYAEPTPEQFASGSFERAGLAYRRVPVIVTLADTGKLSERQFRALMRYRDAAVAADRSPLRSGLDFSPKGNGEGLPHFGVRANIEVGRLERELGTLREIARAVAVDDMTVSQWAITRAGAVMRAKQGVGRKIITWFVPRRAAHEQAMLEIKMAGEWLAAAIGA